MSNEKFKYNFEFAKKEMEELIINKLVNYIRDGNKPNNINSSHYMRFYDITYKFAEKGFGEDFLNYHNSIVKELVNECYEKIKNLTGFDFIDSFILYTERIYALFYYMSKSFKYISENHLKGTEDGKNVRKYIEDDVSEFSMVIYKDNFLNKLEPKLFANLNEPQIQEEINSNLECRKKIIRIIRIIFDMEIIKPKIIKKADISFGWMEIGYYYNNNYAPSERLKKYEDFCKKIGLDLENIEKINII